jgi:hypothetical protein
MQRSVQAITDHCVVGGKMSELASRSSGLKGTRLAPCLEGEISGSVKYEYPTNAGVVHAEGYPTRGALLAPYGTEARLVFVTIRHKFDEDTRIFVDKPYTVGDSVTVFPQRGEPIQAKISAIFCPVDKDVQFCYTQALAQNIPKVEFAPPEVGKAMKITTGSLTKDPKWYEAQGSCCANTQVASYYNFTTKNGDCGFPVFQHNGKVVGIHCYGNSRVQGKRLNGAIRLTWPPIPKLRSSFVPPYTPLPMGEGVLQAAVPGVLPVIRKFVDQNKFRMVEKLKYYGLRQDKNLLGLVPMHHFMKPNTAMNHLEVQKYFDPIQVVLDTKRFAMASAAAVLFDTSDGPGCDAPAIVPDVAILRETLDGLDLTRSAGPTACSLTANDYILALGKGDMEVGKERLIDRSLRLYNSIIASGPELDFDKPGVDADLMQDCSFWNVIGKQDGYKAKKLPVHDPPGSGRTIQAPCLELKLLWKAIYGLNDDMWVSRPDSWVHAGEDCDKPVSHHHMDVLAKALGCIAADLTAFDRLMLQPMINAFFMFYLREVAPGVPKAWNRYLAVITACGPLQLSDGTIYLRTRGNPSGFMNTLRLNCVVHLMCLFYILSIRLDIQDPLELCNFLKHECSISICGDDSRFFALTQRAFDAFDLGNQGAAYLRCWATHLPWEVKLEGAAVYTTQMLLAERALATPPMVSRRYLIMGGVLWEPLYNISRTLKRLASCEDRAPQDEMALIDSAASTLALQIFWQLQGWYFSPAVHFLLREFPIDIETSYRRVANLYREESRQHEPSEGLPASKMTQ